MFCPKCGGQNPETGKYCRSCGTDLGNVSSALAGVHPPAPLVDRRGRPVNWEGAIRKIAMGLAFLAISIVLGATNMAGGRVWWFWMLIPAFTMMGAGVAQYIQLKKLEHGLPNYALPSGPAAIPAGQNHSLPSSAADWVTPETRYKTGDLVPPSVTDSTTRHLEIDKERQTMALPKE